MVVVILLTEIITTTVANNRPVAGFQQLEDIMQKRRDVSDTSEDMTKHFVRPKVAADNERNKRRSRREYQALKSLEKLPNQ